MFGQIYKMFKKFKMIKTFKKAMTCPQCRNKNTYLMEEESKDWEDVEFAWYDCRDCGHKFIKEIFEKARRISC